VAAATALATNRRATYANFLHIRFASGYLFIHFSILEPTQCRNHIRHHAKEFENIQDEVNGRFPSRSPSLKSLDICRLHRFGNRWMVLPAGQGKKSAS